MSDYHRFNVTVSDPQHTYVSKRKEKISKTIRVPKKHPVEKAQQIAAKHYKNLGFNVHSIEHIKEELDWKKKEQDRKKGISRAMKEEQLIDSLIIEGFDEGEIELCLKDFNAVEEFIIEALQLENEFDDQLIIEAIEQYFGQLDEIRRMGYIKSLKVSNHHNRGGFAAPAAMSAAAGAAGGGLATGHKAGAIAGAALGVGTVAAAHLNQVRKDAKMIRGTGHGHKVYSDDFAKAAEDRYDRYKKKPLHKRIATRIRAMNGKGDHIYDSYDPAIAMAAKFISYQNRPETLFHRPVNESVKSKIDQTTQKQKQS